MATDQQARLVEIRRQIDAGQYETPERLSAAVEALWQREFAAGRNAGDLSHDKTCGKTSGLAR